MLKKETPNNWNPDLKPKTELEQKKLDIQKEIMQLENKRRFLEPSLRKKLDKEKERLQKELEALRGKENG